MYSPKSCRMYSTGTLLLAFAAATVAAGTREPVQLDLDAEYTNEYYVINSQVPRHAGNPVAEQTYRPESWALPTDRDATDVILRRSDSLVAHMETLQGAPDLEEMEDRLDTLRPRVENTDVSDVDVRLRLFKEIAAVRRRIILSNPLLDFSKIFFVKSHLSRSGHSCDQYFGKNARGGGGVYVLSDAFSNRPQLHDILADSVVTNGRLEGLRLDTGSFRSPELSFDGKEILFAYTECGRGSWSPKSCFHVFRVNVDGTGLTQLSDGSWNEFDPCWLPNGRIVFVSERRGGFGRCHPRPVPTYTLFSMNRDGGDIVPLSYHETNEWHPSVNNSGMIVYTRWDYIDHWAL